MKWHHVPAWNEAKIRLMQSDPFHTSRAFGQTWFAAVNHYGGVCLMFNMWRRSVSDGTVEVTVFLL